MPATTKFKDLEAQNDRPYSDEGVPLAGSSTAPPPPFEDESSRTVLSPFTDLVFPPAPGESDPPPVFKPYEAEFFLVGNDDIVSHDPHLNSDGEALYRFLLSQSAKHPTYRVYCKGTHDERNTHWVQHRGRDGRSESHLETTNVTIVDFDFCIDIGQQIDDQVPIQWSTPDSEPAYRGRMVREVEVPAQNLSSDPSAGRRKATSEELKSYKRWLKEKHARGLPPWVGGINGWRDGMVRDSEVDVLKSSKTVRQWADEYCASPKYLKEFAYDKVLYGWDIQKLESAIRSTISGRGFAQEVTVEFRKHGSKVYIRPDNRLSRMLSNKWLKFLSIILLIFPFIWLFKRFHSRGGGRWQVCGSAYALKRCVPLNPSEQDDEPNKDQPSFSQPTSRTGKLVGMREGEWFRRWEKSLIRAVNQRFQSPVPIMVPLADDSLVVGPSSLDGY